MKNLIWDPDTCYCKIECNRPSVDGIFIKRCYIHLTTRKTTDVYAHNQTNRTRASEQGTPTKERAGEDRKRQVRESTRP